MGVSEVQRRIEAEDTGTGPQRDFCPPKVSGLGCRGPGDPTQPAPSSGLTTVVPASCLGTQTEVLRAEHRGTWEHRF